MYASIAGRSTISSTASLVRAFASVYGIANKGFRLREVGVFNTTTTAMAVGLAKFTNATGVGAGLTEVAWDGNIDAVIQCTGFAGHTADSAAGSPFRQATIGAAAGAGIIWTFGGSGIIIPAGTANGVGIICPTGTGQTVDYYMDWEE